MQVKQFEDKNLSHFSYAILSNSAKKIVLLDPSRDPHKYIDFAARNSATIIGVIETHPHADFVSSHLEFNEKEGSQLYASGLMNAMYPHQVFDQGATIEFGEIKLTALNTPGHSPDSISILMEHNDVPYAVFTGDTLFIGDCGRPDLREAGGDITLSRDTLARQMYHSLREKLAVLEDDVIVYPAHGAGSLCGKALSKANSSTIGGEKRTNWCLQAQSEDEFVKELLSDQPFMPAYFSWDVTLNQRGAPGFDNSIGNVKMGTPIMNEADVNKLDDTLWIIDVRNEKQFKKGHLSHSINLGEDGKFETWLGSIIAPGEHFYLVSNDADQLQRMINRTAAIGYESQVEAAFISDYFPVVDEDMPLEEFRTDPTAFTILDVRNVTEVKHKTIFKDSIAIPLGNLRARLAEIPTGKPIVVHCSAGYRGAAAYSILSSELAGKTKVYDLYENVKEFM